MQVISDPGQIRAQTQLWRQQKESIALVPTMGHLHAGHLSLIKLAQTRSVRVVVTIFVNPLQFDQAEDLDRYPRSLVSDLEQLKKSNVDIAFTPQVADLYPEGLEFAPRIQIPRLDQEFCGRFRPGHFAGVCTVVAKLFNLISPDIAVFGNKDYQQLLIIKQMVRTLNFNIEVIAGDTQREPDGLALSSRNSLLDPESRQRAPLLYQVLSEIAARFSPEQVAGLEASSVQQLERAGFECEYLAIRDADNLQRIGQNTTKIVVLAAARLGSTRLIDNILFPKP